MSSQYKTQSLVALTSTQLSTATYQLTSQGKSHPLIPFPVISTQVQRFLVITSSVRGGRESVYTHFKSCHYLALADDCLLPLSTVPNLLTGKDQQHLASTTKLSSIHVTSAPVISTPVQSLVAFTSTQLSTATYLLTSKDKQRSLSSTL